MRHGVGASVAEQSRWHLTAPEVTESLVRTGHRAEVLRNTREVLWGLVVGAAERVAACELEPAELALWWALLGEARAAQEREADDADVRAERLRAERELRRRVVGALGNPVLSEPVEAILMRLDEPASEQAGGE